VKRAKPEVPVVGRRKYNSAEGDDTFIHLRLTPEDRQQLRAVLGFMLQDPECDSPARPSERVSYAGAVRYALRLCVERPPAHVSAKAAT
jgi:hypothetical protein